MVCGEREIVSLLSNDYGLRLYADAKIDERNSEAEKYPYISLVD